MKGLFLINIFKVIFVIIGTFIGAGFASGKEIYIFFYKYNIWGIIGILISSGMIFYIMCKTLIISKENKIENYNEFLDDLIKQKIIKKILKEIINLFLIISYCIMISGFCSFIKQEFNINYFFSFLFIIILCIYSFRKKINSIFKLNNILIPIIIIIILFIFIMNIFNQGIIDKFNCIIKMNNEFNFNFFTSSILYANYNLLTIIPIIITIKNTLKNKKQIKIACIVTVIFICILSLAIFCILITKNNEYINFDMPAVAIISSYGKKYKILYCLIIGIAIATTAISVGYSYLQKFENKERIYNKKMILLIIFSAISLKIGFSNLVEILYPVFGIIGFIESIYVIKYRN